MIPPFDHSGCVPPGLHDAALAEIEARFGRQSELRRIFGQSTGREPGDTPCPWARAHGPECAGVQRIVLNGSFVTDTMQPNDVACVLLIGRGFPADPIAEAELNAGLPFLDIALARQADFDEFVGEVFAADRLGTRKGMIEFIT